MSADKVNVIAVYDGSSNKWAIGRFSTPDGRPGVYRIGSFVKGGINFQNRDFSSREDAEGWLVYQIDASVKL